MYTFFLVACFTTLFAVVGSQTHGLPNRPLVGADTVTLEPPLTTLAFGSCSKQYKPQTHWNTILQQNPQAWFWTGDAIYPNCSRPACLRKAYNLVLSSSDYQQFQQQLPFLDGVWDDHDFGLNDGGGSYLYKNISLRMYQDFLNLSNVSNRRERDGMYSSHLFALPPAPGHTNVSLLRVILTDTRYNRDRPWLPSIAQSHIPYTNKAAALLRLLTATLGFGAQYRGDILGAEQWEWLRATLAESYGPNGEEIIVNVFVSSVQIFTMVPVFESWGHFPASRQRLVDLIRETRPKGLVFVSGDVHLAQLLGSEMCVPEVTSSGLTHSVQEHGLVGTLLTKILFPFYEKPIQHQGLQSSGDQPWTFLEFGNQGKVFSGMNFGVMEFQPVSEHDLAVNVTVYDIQGQPQLRAYHRVKNGPFNGTYDCLSAMPVLIEPRNAVVLLLCACSGLVLGLSCCLTGFFFASACRRRVSRRRYISLPIEQTTLDQRCDDDTPPEGDHRDNVSSRALFPLATPSTMSEVELSDNPTHEMRRRKYM